MIPTNKTTETNPDLLLAFIVANGGNCPVCEYELEGLNQHTCPECGTELRLQIGSPRANPGPWVLAVISFALAVGFDGVVGLVLCVTLIAVAMSGTPLEWEPVFLAALFTGMAAAMVTGITLVMRARGRWTRRRVRTQWTLSGVIFAGVGAAHLLIGTLLAMWTF